MVLAPTLFAYDWPKRPETEVALGLRCISERDVQVGKGEASRLMLKMYGDGDSLRDPEKAWECWNDSFFAYVVARAACDPNDMDVPYFQWAQDDSARALTSEGLRFLWDEYSLINRGKGERRQLRDDEVAGLALSLPSIGGLDRETQREVRKHLAWVAELLDKGGLLLAEDDEDVYVVKAAG